MLYVDANEVPLQKTLIDINLYHITETALRNNVCCKFVKVSRLYK